MPRLIDQLLFPLRSHPVAPEAYPRATLAGWVPAATKGRGGIVILSRGLYRNKLFDLSDVPPGQRRAVLRNLLLAWSPFDQSELRVVLRGDVALAFAWDDRQLREQRPEGVGSGLTLLPECMLREPMADGVRLLACLDGYELQLWRGGTLQNSRWWAQMPSSADLASFVRALPAEVRDAVGEPMLPVRQVAWQSRPWAELLNMGALASNVSRFEQLVAGASLVVLAAFTGAQGSDWLRAYREYTEAQSELASAKLAATPVLSARDRALAQAREADALARQLQSVQPVQVLQHLSEVLPSQGVLLREFELNGTKLRLGLELSADVQRSKLIAALQSGAWFTAVTEVRDAPGRSWVNFDVTLSGLTPLQGSSGAKAGAIAR